MNSYDFTQPGGFPFDQGVMAFLQDCINTASQAASLAGPLAILSGCVVAGGSVSDGFVFINGEILPFVGGLLQTQVVIDEEDTPLVYQDGTPRVVKHTRTARFGEDGVTEYMWADFKRNSTEGVLARLDAAETEIDTLNDTVATLGEEITALEATRLIKLDSGTKVIGDADPNHSDSGEGGLITINLNGVQPDANYMVIFTIISLSASAIYDQYHNVTLRTKRTNSFDLYFREVAARVQNVNVDWMIVKF